MIRKLLKINAWKIAGAILGFMLVTMFAPSNFAFAQVEGDVDFDNVTASTAPAPIVGAIKKVAAAVGGFAANIILLPILLLATMFDTVAGYFVLGMGYILDLSIATTISSDYYGGLSIIKVGWTTVRDFSNMFFIFALLFIAIKTILGMAGSSTKRWVANLIIAAILINFSLFATKVVIDAGNVLALGFWSKMEVTVGGTQKLSASAQILEGLKLQSITDPSDSTGKPLDLSTGDKIIIYAVGGIVKLIVAYILLAGAIMMIIRSVTLILLMIVSPFAFLGFGLPVAGSFANKWLSKLIGSTFVAPAFIAMLYITSTIINSPDLGNLTGSTGRSWGGALGGDISSYSIVYNYVLIIILFLSALSVANAVSAGAGSAAGAWAKKGLGAGAAGAALGFGAAGRQTVGRFGKSRLNNEAWVKKQNQLVARAGMKDATAMDKIRARGANAKLATYGAASKGTFDVRNAKVAGVGVGSALALGGVNAGQGTKRNFDQHGAVGSSVTGGYRGTDKEKELIETSKDRFKGAPEAQEAYLRQRMGTDGEKNALDATRNKETLKQIERDKVTVEAKNNLKKAIDPKAEGALIGEAAADAIKKSLAMLSGKEAAEILGDKPEYLSNPSVIAALTSKELTALDTTKLPQETIDALTTGIVQNGTDSARKHLKNQAKVGGVLQYNSEAELQKLTKDYDDKEISLKGDDAGWKAYEENQRKEIGKALGMVGGATEITQLDDKLITHKALVSQYNSKVVREFQKKIKDGDFEGSFGDELNSQLQAHNTRATKNSSPTAGAPKEPSLIATPTPEELGKYGQKA